MIWLYTIKSRQNPNFSHRSQTCDEHVKLGLKMSNSRPYFACVCNKVAVSLTRVRKYVDLSFSYSDSDKLGRKLEHSERDCDLPITR